MKKKLTGLLVGVMLMLASGSANAYLMPAPDTWGNLGGFVSLDYFQGTENLITALNFSGEWKYTAIGTEAGNINIVERGNIDATNPTNEIFNNYDYSNWGAWRSIDFDVKNLYFSDSDGPVNVRLDPITGTTTAFKVYQLVNDSYKLNYLPDHPNRILPTGTYIIGFNDNALGTGDGDYDDMIIAIRPVPEPTTMLLLGLGLIGLAGVRRKFKK